MKTVATFMGSWESMWTTVLEVGIKFFLKRSKIWQRGFLSAAKEPDPLLSLGLKSNKNTMETSRSTKKIISLNDIPPINITRDRRKNPDTPITKDELQSLRGLIGSLQYAATNTRPDLSCRLGLLQAKVTCATVADLLTGNRILNDAKKYADTAIRIQALPLEQIRFLSFLDAAFATREREPIHKRDA